MLLQHTGFNDALNVCRSLLQYDLNIAYIHVERIRVKPVLHLFLFSVVSLCWPCGMTHISVNVCINDVAMYTIVIVHILDHFCAISGKE